jgi:hypothetical protein
MTAAARKAVTFDADAEAGRYIQYTISFRA